MSLAQEEFDKMTLAETRILKDKLLTQTELLNALESSQQQSFQSYDSFIGNLVMICLQNVIIYPISPLSLLIANQWYEDIMRDESPVFCPICQKSNLDEIPNFIVCYGCGLRLKSDISLQELNLKIQVNVNEHSRNCNSNNLGFSLASDDAVFICMTCAACSLLVAIDTTVDKENQRAKI